MTVTPASRVLVKRKRTQAPLDGLVMTDLTHPTKRVCFYRLDSSEDANDDHGDSRCPMLDIAKNQTLLSSIHEMAIEGGDDGVESQKSDVQDEYVIDSYRIESKMDPKVFQPELIGRVVWDANEESKLVWAEELGSEDSDSFEDDSDSNAENNWRNEYPDESDFDEKSWQDSSDYEVYKSSSDDNNSEEWY